MKKNSRWKKAGLRKAVDKALYEDSFGGYEDGEWASPFQSHLGFIPDAFWVRPDKRTVALLEVEDTSAIDKVKLERIVNFWFGLDCESWSCEVHIYNVMLGKMIILTDNDLARLFHDGIEEKIARQKSGVQQCYL